LLIVVEIDIRRLQLASPSLDPSRPRAERGLRIVALILFLPRPVETDIDKIRGQFDRRAIPGQLIETERRVVRTQQAIDAVAMPARLAKLEGVSEPGRQRVQKRLEPIVIARPVRWKLKQHRTEL